MPRALLSVSDKTGLVDLGRGLAARGFELVSTGGTARALGDAGLAVTNISEVTGFPEMMDGRVKTLHPAVHGGILARRDRSGDLAALEAHGIGLVDIVVVNLYPFVKAAADPATPFDVLVEEIDIGGPSLVRAAAKNFRHVLVVVDPADYPRLLSEIDRGPSLTFRFELMRTAFAHTAAYDSAIAATLLTTDVEQDRVTRKPVSPSSAQEATLELSLFKIRELRYGENPHQAASWYRYIRRQDEQVHAPRSIGFGGASILQGKELSYTNLLDLDAAARITVEFDEPAAVVIKHTNPCGAATGSAIVQAYQRARDADRLAAYGGIVGLNRAIDSATAEELVSTFIEAVVAPAVSDEARAILARKTNMRVIAADFSAGALGDPSIVDVELRSILGGMLVQDRDRVIEARRPWTGSSLPDGLRMVTKRAPTPEEWEALRFAWRISAHVKSNAVIFTDATHTFAIGAGQMSRVDAVHVAVMKALSTGMTLAGSVAASDAFFPFRDGLDAVAAAGATAVVQPGGSVRDADVIAAADEHGLAMVFTGRRHFRH
jgi:phosphoribosylaminoimidazolecarboxamide formyltransferase / IMP cyclohydrolase